METKFINTYSTSFRSFKFIQFFISEVVSSISNQPDIYTQIYKGLLVSPFLGWHFMGSRSSDCFVVSRKSWYRLKTTPNGTERRSFGSFVHFSSVQMTNRNCFSLMILTFLSFRGLHCSIISMFSKRTLNHQNHRMALL